jgi:hypothetical protein
VGSGRGKRRRVGRLKAAGPRQGLAGADVICVDEGASDPPVLIRNACADLVVKPIEGPGLKRPYAACYVDVLGGAEPKGVS